MASGDLLTVFLPGDQEEYVGGTNANRASNTNGDPAVSFPDSVDTYAAFKGFLEGYSGSGGITITLHCGAVASGGDFDIDVALERCETGSWNTNSFGTVTSDDNNAPPATAQDRFQIAIVVSAANMDSVANTELYRLRVMRDGVNDTNGNDLFVYAIEVRET